ncbi:MAG: hypothetical protein K1W28_01555 [Lachnospiraceae bacterium]
MKHVKIDLGDLAVEVSRISAIVAGLANQADKNTETLTPEALRNALGGVSSYLDRISDNLDRLDAELMKKD